MYLTRIFLYEPRPPAKGQGGGNQHGVPAGMAMLVPVM